MAIIRQRQIVVACVITVGEVAIIVVSVTPH